MTLAASNLAEPQAKRWTRDEFYEVAVEVHRAPNSVQRRYGDTFVVKSPDVLAPKSLPDARLILAELFA